MDDLIDNRNISLTKSIRRWLVLWRENHRDLEEIAKMLSGLIKGIDNKKASTES